MKRLMLILTLVLAAVFIAAFGVYAAAAAEDDSAVPELVVADKFGGDALSLSLSDAVERYKSAGETAAKAQAGRAKAAAVAAASDLPAQRRAFAVSQGPLNYQAQMNSLAEKVSSAYYQALQSRAFLEAEKENYKRYRDLALEIGRGIREITDWLAVDRPALIYGEEIQRKRAELAVYKEDYADVLNDLVPVKAAAEAFAVDLEAALMKLNALLDYDVMQKLDLSDKLPNPELPATTAEAAVKSALENRNEIKGAAHRIVMESLRLNQLRMSFPPTSEEYLDQLEAVADAKAELAEYRKNIEIEVRDGRSRLELYDAGYREAQAAKAKQPAAKAYAVRDEKSNLTAIRKGFSDLYALELKSINFKAMFALAAGQFENAVQNGVAIAAI